MLLSNDCYVVENCGKYISGNCPHNEYCPRLFKLDYLYNQSELSASQRRYTKLYVDEDGTDREAFRQLTEIQKHIDEFVKNGYNLYLHSRICGNGKSTWSIRMIQAYLNNIWADCELECKALYVNVPRFLYELKESISKKSDYITNIKDNALTADIIVWDEIGVKNPTQFEYDTLLQMINTRLDLNKSNIYTSNADPNEIREKMGDRLYSRICNGAVDIELFGSDKRGLFKFGENKS